MAAAAATISSATSTANTSFSCISPFPQTLKRTTTHSHVIGIGFPSSINRNIRGIKVAAAAETDEKETAKTVEDKKGSASASASTSTSTPTPTKQLPKKPVYSMKKGQIVRVDKEKYLNSVNYLSVGHPPYYKGLDYIYEDRGEVLDIRIFETGEYALIAWVGIPTAPAWLPTDMLIKSEKLNYERL